MPSSSSLNSLPEEVLVLIINTVIYSDDASPYPASICPYRQVCKRWKVICEKHFFKKLCFNLEKRPFEDLILPFKEQPDLGKLVNVIEFKQELTKVLSRTYLTESFFELFPNIKQVVPTIMFGFYPHGWELFNQTFTPSRCQLDTIPYIECFTSDIQRASHQIAIDHRATLVHARLDCTGLNQKQFDVILSQMQEFQKLKGIEIIMETKRLQDFDTLIHKLPSHLSSFDFSFDCGIDIPDGYRPRAAIQQPMSCSSVSLKDICSSDNLHVLDHMLSRISNVHELSVSKAGAFGGDAEDLIHTLYNALNMVRTSLSFHISSLPSAGLLPVAQSVYSTYDRAWKGLEIRYDEKGWNTFTRGSQDGFLNVRYQKPQSPPEYPLKLNSSPKESIDIDASYSEYGTKPREFLEGVGQHVNSLSLRFNCSDFSGINMGSNDTTLSNTLFHAIQSCTSLRYLYCWQSSFDPTNDYNDSPFINETLEHVCLDSTDVRLKSLKSLEQLSRQAPNIHTFQLTEYETSYGIVSSVSNLTIVMPHNDFRSMQLKVFNSIRPQDAQYLKIKTASYGERYFCWVSNDANKHITQITEEEFNDGDQKRLTIECKSLHHLCVDTFNYECDDIFFDQETGLPALKSS